MPNSTGPGKIWQGKTNLNLLHFFFSYLALKEKMSLSKKSGDRNSGLWVSPSQVEIPGRTMEWSEWVPGTSRPKYGSQAHDYLL